MRAPGSKSLAARWLVLAAQEDRGTTTAPPPGPLDEHRFPGLPAGDDTAAMVAGLATMPDGHVACGRAGTVLRFLLPLAATGTRAVTFTGEGQLARRPLAPLVTALRQLGASVSADTLPLTVRPGAQAADVVEVNASASSQLVSGLLLAAPALPRGLTVRWRDAPSAGHIALTLHCLAAAGIETRHEIEPDGPHRTHQVRVSPAVPRVAAARIEPDLPAAAPFLLATALLGGRMSVAGWPDRPAQHAAVLTAALTALGARTGPGLTVTAGGHPAHGIDLDLRDHAELLPVIGTAAAFAAGPSRLTGLAHARGHESDRVGALAANLTAIGTHVIERPGALVIEPRPTRAAVWRTHDDHRLVMAGALAGLLTPGLVLDDDGAVTKTFPGFLDHWRMMFERTGA